MPLTPLKPGSPVLVKADEESVWKKEGTVVAADPENRTYLVNSPAGVLRRNRKHLQKLPSPRRVVTGGASSRSSSTSDSQDVNDSKDIDSKEVASLCISYSHTQHPSGQRLHRTEADPLQGRGRNMPALMPQALCSRESFVCRFQALCSLRACCVQCHKLCKIGRVLCAVPKLCVV